MRALEDTKVGIVGLGYVGCRWAVEFGRRYETVGFDIDAGRVAALERGHDATLESPPTISQLRVVYRFTATRTALEQCNVYIVAVPTPIDAAKRPLLTPLVEASRTVGASLSEGDVVVYESTVYPGCTEELCVPILERESGLTFNEEFCVGYSPERINPGDKSHRLPDILKVTSGSTPEAADFVDALYASIVTAGTHRAPTIKVAEAAKVIENNQRVVNIALVNELALIFNRLGIDTEDVLVAAGTKWNFLPFSRDSSAALHRCGSVLSDAQGGGDRYHPEMTPRRAGESTTTWPRTWRPRSSAHDSQVDASRRARASCAGADLQGELPRHPQYPGCRYPQGARGFQR